MKETLKERFIRRANKKHNNKFDYDKVVYINCDTKITISCPIHGEFEQIPYSHLNTESGCKQCGVDIRANKRMDTTTSFITKAVLMYGEDYDYSKVEYINSHTKVIIICKTHGEFSIRPNDHLRGKGCKECGILSASAKRKLGLPEFIYLSNIKHHNKYTYNNAVYINGGTKLSVTCPKHGDFNVTPNNHIGNKSECPVCNESKGEASVRAFLEKSNIKFTPQMRFDTCVYKYRLPFDFYIPQYNLLIEYDGIQHFKPVTQWGGEQYLLEIQEKDQIKNQYCIDHNIRLCRIPYTDIENINDILTKEFNEINIISKRMGC